MNARHVLAGIVLVSLLSTAAAAQGPAGSGTVAAPAPPGTATAVAPPCWSAGDVAVPVIGLLLQCSEELGLSGPQMDRLERLGIDLMREQIRREADLRIAQLDLAVLLRPDPEDPGKPADITRAEAKIREVERITADLHVAQLRAVEASKAELSPDQRRTLATLLSAGPLSPLRGPAGGVPPRSAPGGPVSDVRPPAYLQRPASTWYYCPSAGAYYPYVQTCPRAWVPVVPRTD